MLRNNAEIYGKNGSKWENKGRNGKNGCFFYGKNVNKWEYMGIYGRKLWGDLRNYAEFFSENNWKNIWWCQKIDVTLQKFSRDE